MGHLKLKDGTTFPLNLSVGDIRDISKRSGAFSKTVTLVGDDDNNNLLNHYYDVNVQAGTFDINKLEQCQVIQNGIVILDNAYMQLIEVVKSQTTDAHNQKIEYKVLVKDSVSDFFTKLGNKTLNDINMQEIIIGTGSLSYEATNVTGSFNNTITDGYKFLMPQNVTAGLYNLKAFHPAMYAKTYFDAIFQGAGFTYEWGNQSPSVHTTNDNYFEKLVIPYNGGTPQIDRNDYLVEATRAVTPITTTTLWEHQLTNFTEVTDTESIFDPVNGDYAVPFYVQNPENIMVQVTIDIDVNLVNNDFATYPTVYAAKFLDFNGLERPRYFSAAIKVKNQASIQEYSQKFHGSAGWLVQDTLTASTTPIATNYAVTLNIPVTQLDNTDILEFYIQSLATTQFTSVSWSGLYYQDAGFTTQADVDLDITINSSTWKILPSTDTIGYQSELNLNTYVPKKIKQADFIKSIFMMYNLYAEVDPTQPNKLILRSRDDYYDAGTERDWTAKLAKDSDQTLQFLPELSAKKMVLSYKDDKDDINEIYKEATNETYGQVEFTFENEYVKGIDRKELIFSPTPIVKTDFDAYVPALSYIPEVNVRILIDGGTQTCNEFGIVDYYINGGGYSGATDQTTAPLLTHFDDPETPSFDLNFAVCDYYFYSDFSQRTNNNLYNLYWRRTLGQIDKGKMLTAFFDLNEVDIQSLKLNDKIRIDNSWWHINRVIDYDANEHKLTKVELISVDEEIEFTPFATSPTIPSNPIQPPVRPVRPVKPTNPQTVRPVQDIKEKNKKASNIYHGDSIVMGTNNYIGADVTAALIIGDDNIVEENKILAPVIETTEKLILADGTEISNSSDITGLGENFANTDLTSTGNRTHDTQLYSLTISADGATLANEWFSLASRAAYLGFGNNYNRFTNTGLDTFIGGSNRFSVNTTDTVINEGGNNYDTRIEGQTDANLVFVDASTDRVGIGTNTPSHKLDVNGTIRTPNGGNTSYNITQADADVSIILGTNGTSDRGYIKLWGNTAGDYGVVQMTTSNLHLDSDVSGKTLINFYSDTDVVIGNNTWSGKLGIGTTTPTYKLDVNGDINVPTGSAYYHNATAGLSGTYTFGGGTTGDIATMTFSGGILTAITTVP